MTLVIEHNIKGRKWTDRVAVDDPARSVDELRQALPRGISVWVELRQEHAWYVHTFAV